MMSEDYLDKSHGVFEVRGAAGAGKTYQLCCDIAYLTAKNKTGVVISFSHVAVDELTDRTENQDKITIRTIHSFCWYVLSSIRTSILNSDILKGIFKPEALTNLSQMVNFDSQSISDIVYGNDENSYPFYDMGTKVLGLSHNDVIALFNLAMDKFPALQSLIEKSIDFLLIDEYQDTNSDFLQRLFQYLSPKILIGVYGDPFQSIYADERVKLNQFGGNVDQCVLPDNYRSAVKIVEFLNDLRRPFDSLQQSAQRRTEGLVNVVVSDGPLDAKKVAEIEKEYHFSPDRMTLSLTNFYKANVLDFGEIARYVKNEVLFQLTGIRNLPWQEVINSTQLNGKLTMLLRYLEFEQSNGYVAAQALLTIFTPESIALVKMEEISRVKELAQKGDYSPVQGLMNLGLKCNSGWNQVLQVAEKLTPDISKGIFHFYHSLSDMDRISRTVFASKGQEFDSVILNIDSNWSLRDWNQINFSMSENDVLSSDDMLSYLFYVGASRAKKQLIIFVNRVNEPTFLSKFKDHLSRAVIKCRFMAV